MSKKNANNRLENLFANLKDQDSPEFPLSEPTLLLSWSWETDANGIYTSCSPEITSALGLKPNDFIGSPLLNCHIAKKDRKNLLEQIQKDIFPFELDLHMVALNDKVVLARFHVYKIINDSKSIAFFRGFTQLLEEVSSSFSHPEEVASNTPAQIITPESPAVEISHEETTISAESRQEDLANLPNASVEEGLNQMEQEFAQSSQAARIIEPPVRKTKLVKPDFSKLSKTAPLGPLPSFLSDLPFGGTAPLQSQDLNGIALEGDNFKPSGNVWTQQALVSFNENVVISSPATPETPAILASPLKLRDQKTGVIELVDSDSSRKWSEEDRLLMQEISNQLGLALENAQLYSTVQKELGERIKAEELTERRNRDLATLNQIGQRLNRLASRDEIFKFVSSMMQETMNLKNILISVYDSENDSLSFPVCVANGENISIPARKVREGYQESLLKSHAPLVLNLNPLRYLENEVLDHPLKSPTSMVAVPLMTGDRALGVITLLNSEVEKVFDHIQVELISTIATQAATSLENSNLFENISSALETIGVRERYQANVTKAVALLSESGSRTMPQILEFLSAAANCERTYFAEPALEKEGGLVWSATTIYIKPGANVFLSNDLLSRMVATEYPAWLNDLNLKGWHAITAETAQGAEKNYLVSQKITSLLLLSVPRENNLIGFIAFETFSASHGWQKEEVDVLRIASDAVTNTLIREELLKQVQSSLEETENLYVASHQLALSNTMQEMLSAVIQGAHSQNINRGVLILFDYNEANQVERMVVQAN